MNKLLSERVNVTATSIRNDIQHCRRIVLGMDCWSKKGLTSSYLAISASFFNPRTHKPTHVLLNLHMIAHPHTGDMLAEKIAATLREWSIPLSKLLTVITDNGSNMLKAIKCVKAAAESMQQQHKQGDDDNESDSDTCSQQDSSVDESEDDSNLPDNDNNESDSESPEDRETMTEEFDDDDDDDDMGLPTAVGVNRMPCLAHTLQLVLKAVDSVKTYHAVILKARKLVKFFKISSVATQKLLGKCNLTLVTDCATRWNSCYLMIERLIAVRMHVTAVLDEMKSDMPLLHSDWDKLEKLAKLLKPIKCQTDYMQSDNIALSNVIPCLLELNLTFKDPTQDKQLCTTLSKALRNRFSGFLDPDSVNFDALPSAACLLDPTVAVCMFRDDTATLLTEAKHFIKKLVRFCIRFFILYTEK